MVQHLAIHVKSFVGLPGIVRDNAVSEAAILKYLSDVAVKIAFSELPFQDALVAIAGKTSNAMGFGLQGCAHVYSCTVFSNATFHVVGNIQLVVILIKLVNAGLLLDV